jgi:hypothetical protein
MFCHTGPLVLGYITITRSLIMCVKPNELNIIFVHVCLQIFHFSPCIFFVANKSLNVRTLLVLVPKVKIPRKICSFHKLKNKSNPNGA